MIRKRSLLCISLLLILALFGCKKKSAGEAEVSIKVPEKGDMFTDVTLQDLQGKTFTLSQYKGKVMILNFWATWCPPCREEMPSMDALYQKFKGTDLVIIPASIDEDPKTVSKFMQKNNYTMPVYYDPDKQAGSTYGLTGVPETFIINRNGKIEEKIIGPIDWMRSDVIKLFEDLLK